MTYAWNETYIGKVMIEPVDTEEIEHYGVATLGGEASEPRRSVP